MRTETETEDNLQGESSGLPGDLVLPYHCSSNLSMTIPSLLPSWYFACKSLRDRQEAGNDPGV